MKVTGPLVLIALTLGATHVACGPQNELIDVGMGGSSARRSVAAGETCEPGQVPSASEDPFAACRTITIASVPDLGRPKTSSGPAPQGVSGGLELLDAVGGARPSCVDKRGPGFDTCGPNQNESCCVTANVPADPQFQVDAFDLDVYEVTSARYAAFVEATGGNLRAAATAADWPGWKDEWNQHLPGSREALDIEMGVGCDARSDVRNYGALTWPSDHIVAAVNELMNDDNDRAADIRADATAPRLSRKPINCVSYYAARAFCSWEGGRLPSLAEWGYAAGGGVEQRRYAWGDELGNDKVVTDTEKLALRQDTYFFTFPDGFPHNGNGQNAYHIAPPGQKPAGTGRWGHRDLNGNLLEWVADIEANTGFLRGGSWEGHNIDNVAVHAGYPLDRTYGALGFRCAFGAEPKVQEPVDPVDPPGQTVPVLRSVHTGRYLQGLAADASDPQFTSEGTGFRVWSTQVEGTRPLLHCAAGDDHFLSNDAACEGQRVIAAVGFALDAQAEGSLPLYRCYQPRIGAHLSTVTPGECERLGMNLEGTQGFVVPPPPNDFVRLQYRAGLSREAESGGHQGSMEYFRANGCNDGTLAQFSVGLYTSPEFTATELTGEQKVQRLYRGVLEREPDAEGQAYYVSQLANGRPWAEIVGELTAAQEARALTPKRCDQQQAPVQDSCANRADGWYCSEIAPNHSYQCTGGVTAGGSVCGEACVATGEGQTSCQ